MDLRPDEVREDLTGAVERAWCWLAQPGTWLTGKQKLDVVAEVRRAASCGLCRERSDALSPYTVAGEHEVASALSGPLVEVTHRIATDSGRLTATWFDRMADEGLTDEIYVETVAVIATAIALDTFDRALGRERRALPTPLDGEPTRYRPVNARRQLAWVATLEPGDITPDDPDIFARYHPPYNIQKALSLVPDAMAAFFDLDETFYLQEQEILDFATDYRAISHDQMELVAARLSALNRCYY